jgi:hypothetical protein
VVPDTSIITFFTTHSALCAERAARQANIPARLILTPRMFSVDCTVALSFHSSHREQLCAILRTQEIEINGVHDLGSKM